MQRISPTRPANLAALVLGGLALGSCSSTGTDTKSNIEEWADRTPTTVRENHWNIGSVTPRMVYAFTGYRPEDWKTYRDFQYEDKRDMNNTMRRHFLNRNPASPLQAKDPDYGQERPPHSIWPRPENYFHINSLIVGGALSASSAGVFLPIPYDSIIATLEEGGGEEFSAGLYGTDDPISRHTRIDPPPTAEFRLANETAPPSL